MGDNRVQTASGSGIKEEGKFRQRVENHYKIMADARSSLKTHSKLQMAAALGLVTVVGMGVALDEADALEGLLAGSAGLVLGVASRSRELFVLEQRGEASGALDARVEG